jgi:hypothetical protein
MNTDKSLLEAESQPSCLGDVRRSIYEYFTDAEIGLFAHLVKEHSKSEKWDDYKQKKLDKLECKLKQLRSF